MHYQLAPRAETKMVRCIRGSLYDVILDLREGSPTFGQSFGAELSAENRRMMYVPKGFAHGFFTLTDDAEAFYFVDEFYAPGVRARGPLGRPEVRHRLAGRAGRAVGEGPRLARLRPGLAPRGGPWGGAESIMKILFTGGSSFTGMWFIRELAAAGHEVTAVFRRRGRRVCRRGPAAAGGPGRRGRPAGLRLLVRRRAVPRPDRRGGLGPALPPRRRRDQLQEPRLRRRRGRGEQHPQPGGGARGPEGGRRPPGAPDGQRLRGGRGGRLAGPARLLPLRPVQGA